MLAVNPVLNLTHCTHCDYSNGEYTEKNVLKNCIIMRMVLWHNCINLLRCHDDDYDGEGVFL